VHLEKVSVSIAQLAGRCIDIYRVFGLNIGHPTYTPALFYAGVGVRILDTSLIHLKRGEFFPLSYLKREKKTRGVKN